MSGMSGEDEKIEESGAGDLTALAEEAIMSESEEEVAGEVPEIPETDESSGEAQTSEDGPSTEGELPKDEDVRPAAPEPVKGEDSVARLEREMADLREQNRALLSAFLGQQKVPEKPSPESEVPERAVRLALYGGDPKAWEEIEPEIRAKAQKVAEAHVSKETTYALNPRKRYEGEIRQAVIEDVFQILDPILRDFHERKARDLVNEHLTPLKDEAQIARAKQILQDLPGSKSSRWEDQAKALETAAKLARAEHLEKLAQEREQRAAAGKAQREATGGGRLRAATTGAGAPRTGIPGKSDDESWVEYYNRVKVLLTDRKGK